MTQVESAQRNITTPLVNTLARSEKVSAQFLRKGLAAGKIVIPHNNIRRIKRPCAIGQGLRVKVNANLGTSTDKLSPAKEIEKLKISVKYGADTVMDLSVGRGLENIRRLIIKYSPVPVGTVPVYGIAVKAKEEKGDFLKFDAADMLEELLSQAQQGVDFFTIHSGVTKKSLLALKRHKRLLEIVSRGGAILANWIKSTGKENPFYEYFDEILEIAYKYDITLSLGDGMRPGSISDASDSAQMAELKILGGLTLRARKKKVQVIIEGPGHVPLNQIEKNIRAEKKICQEAPFYVLGPLVTDIAAGYDHINSAIGGALAASAGADFLCYVTPAEHLSHPSAEDVKEGVIASRIAAHAADIARGRKDSLLWDKKISLARKARDWKKQAALSLDPEKAKKYRAQSKPADSGVCTMCGDFCSIKLIDECMRA